MCVHTHTPTQTHTHTYFIPDIKNYFPLPVPLENQTQNVF